jgi:energy-coupling factor transport system ATP-binding protein
MAMPITLTDVSVQYIGRKDPAFSAVTLTLRPGETVLLLGASGSGKSTLALTLNGLIPHSVGARLRGQVQVEGLDTQHTTVAELARKVGIIFQDPDAQFVTLKVEDEIVFGLENLGMDPASMRAAVDAALQAVGMAHARERPTFVLSGGEKQRIALAALLAMEPRVLVFDEPTANLDPAGTREVFDLIARYKAQHDHTLVLIEHKLDALMHLIDRVIVLGPGGALIADGPPRRVFDQLGPRLRAEGVWMPQVCQLAHRLREQGRPLPFFPITLDEAADMLSALAPPAVEPGQGQLPRLAIGVSTDPAPPPPHSVAGLQAGRQAPGDHADGNTRTPKSAPLAVEVKALTCQRGGRTVLDRVSLPVPSGDFLAIVGANGAGKTTLAYHLMGLLPAPRGTVLIEGRDVSQITPGKLVERVGFVFQNPEHQFVTESVFAEVAYGLRAKGLAPVDVTHTTETMLARFGLTRLAHANPFTLSHGQKRRLSVASMLAVGQRTLILDEPTFGQDQRNAEALMALLTALHQEGRTVIIITHDMALVAEHARHVAVLIDGRLRFHGAPRDLFAQPDLLRQARLALPPIAQLAQRVPGLAGTLRIEDACAQHRVGADPSPEHQPSDTQRRR